MLNCPSYKQEIEFYTDYLKQLLIELRSKTVLITGASGLIGSYLIDVLMEYNKSVKEKISVVAVDFDEKTSMERFSLYLNEDCFSYFNRDINGDTEYISKKLDYVVHAASNTSPIDYANDPVGTICTNVIATQKLLELARKNLVKNFLFCSSVEAYGQNNGDVDDFDESYSGYVDCNTVRAGYPSGKRAAESMCNAYGSQYGVYFTIARIGRIYGPTIKEGDSKAPTQFIMNAVKGEDIVLKSAGTQTFSYGYVGDCASALIYLLVRGENGQAYNVADDKSKTMLKLFAQKCADLAGTQCRFVQQDEVEKRGYSKITKATMNVDKLKRLGWEAKKDLDAGLKSTISVLKCIRGE
ncbi:MAG: NAD-dependent epimerase/dehydratase family protein [Clostridia bacterium]|nr:NAD-dependent epimerase/dehydratase family protein [Clostridia bacterium]